MPDSTASNQLNDAGRELYRLIVQAIQDHAVFGLDAEGRILSWNPGAERIFGRREDEVRKRPFADLFSDPSETAAAAALMDTLRRAGNAERELWFSRRDGTRLCAHLSAAAAAANDGGASPAYAIVARDITSRHRMEEMWGRIIQAAPNALIMVNPQGRIILANPQAERLFLYSQEELAGKSIEMLVPARSKSKHREYREAFYADAQARPMGAGRDLYGVRKDGKEVPVEIGLNPIRTPEGVFVLSSIVDITERKKAEDKFRLAVEAAPNAMIMVNGEGQIVLVNAQTEKLFGYSRSELVGQTIEMLVPQRFRPTHPHHRAMFYGKPAIRPMGAGRDLFGLRKDGSEMPVEIGLNPVETGEGMFVLASVVDITERKEAERRLEERRNELEKVNLELDRFVYTASHDLRAPLRGIAAFASFLKEDYFEKLDEQGRDYLDEIGKGVGRMSALIDDLLTLSRISRIHNPYEVADAKLLVAEAIERLRPASSSPGLRLDVQPDLPALYCDRIKMTQVFVNLISNAIKFSAKQDSPHVEIGYNDRGDEHEFRVRDNGIGVDPRHHEQIFDLFRRLHTQEQYEGTGAGLNIVKRIVEEHGGRVWIESDEGAGATFRFTVPKRLGAEGGPAGPERSAAASD